MKLLKVTPAFYVVVDDTPLEDGDYCCHLVTRNLTTQHEGSCYGDWKKVIASTEPMPGVSPLDLEEVKAFIGDSQETMWEVDSEEGKLKKRVSGAIDSEGNQIAGG